jgi:hypothetical protein
VTAVGVGQPSAADHLAILGEAMHRTAVTIAALLLVTATTPVLAGGGPPKLANIEVGPYLIALYNDSPDLVTGSNTLTVKVPDLAAEHAVRLELAGPNGEHLAVPLRPVIVLDQVDDGEHSHADEQADAHGAPAAAPSVGNNVAHGPTEAHEAVGHEQAPADPHAAHGVAAPANHEPSEPPHRESETYLARGSVSIPSTGRWTARIVVRDPHGAESVGETPVTVAQGGPSRLYLGFTGTLIFGSMLFGMIRRRRGPSRAAVAR